MVAYGFKERFAEPILAGTKAQTIRPKGKRRHARDGDTIQLYTGMRTKKCRLIATAPCVGVWPIHLWFAGHDRVMIGTMLVDLGTSAELDAFAVKDGFADWSAMKAFWLDVHETVDDFIGMLIRWRPIGAVLWNAGSGLAQPTTVDIEEVD